MFNWCTALPGTQLRWPPPTHSSTSTWSQTRINRGYFSRVLFHASILASIDRCSQLFSREPMVQMNVLDLSLRTTGMLYYIKPLTISMYLDLLTANSIFSRHFTWRKEGVAVFVVLSNDLNLARGYQLFIFHNGIIISHYHITHPYKTNSKAINDHWFRSPTTPLLVNTTLNV